MQTCHMLSIKRWCNQTSLEELLGCRDGYFELEDGHTISMSLPLFYDEARPELNWLKKNEGTTFPFRMDYDIGSRYVAHMKNLNLVSDFFLMGNASILIEESYHSKAYCSKVLHAHPEFTTLNFSIGRPDGRRHPMEVLVHSIKGNPVRIDDPCVIIGGRCARNYWHWMTEILPKIWILELIPELKSYRTVLPPLTEKFQIESLAAMGFNPDRAIQLRPPLNASFDRAVLPSLFSPNGYSHTLVDWYAGRLGLEKYQKDGKKRIFVTRSKAVNRRVANESDLIRALRKLDFETYELDGMSFMEQVRLFAGAEIVVATHGAGITNMLFAGRDAKLIEIIHEGIFSKYYWMLAGAGRQPYTFYCGSSVHNDQDLFNRNIFVEIRPFVNLVEKMVKV